MTFIEKPEDMHVDVIHKATGVGIRITAGDVTRDISIALATYLAAEVAAAVVLASEVHNGNGSNHQAVHEPDLSARKGAGNSMLRWHRAQTGDYVTIVKGRPLRVFSEGRGRWFAQAGRTVLNPDLPVTSKAAAVGIAEQAVINL